ncbi:MAG: DUF1640 domain-containing protein [Candidatus Lambdaproteobacteria bacterium]|nr:DUF1640 domain-containing protein [Candidatus Lambdaproteobacteria bacterium]
MPFDTHAYVKRLVAAGMPEAQAEVQAEALAEIVLAQVATKDDLRLAVADLKRDMADLKRDMELLESRLGSRLEAELRKQLVWFFGMLVVLAGALVALLRALPPPS